MRILKEVLTLLKTSSDEDLNKKEMTRAVNSNLMHALIHQKTFQEALDISINDNMAPIDLLAKVQVSLFHFPLNTQLNIL